MLSLDGNFLEASLPPVGLILNYVLPEPFTLKLFHRSYFRHDSLPVPNDLAGSLEKLINYSFMVTRMLGLTGVLVVSGDVVKGMSRTKV